MIAKMLNDDFHFLSSLCATMDAQAPVARNLSPSIELMFNRQQQINWTIHGRKIHDNKETGVTEDKFATKEEQPDSDKRNKSRNSFTVPECATLNSRQQSVFDVHADYLSTTKIPTNNFSHWHRRNREVSLNPCSSATRTVTQQCAAADSFQQS